MISSVTAPDGDLRRILGDTFTYRDVKDFEIRERQLYLLRASGEVVNLGRGVYRWADAPSVNDDLVEIAARAEFGTICLETALARHGLIDSAPAAMDIAIPRGGTRPLLRTPIRLHQFAVRTFDIGRDFVDVSDRESLGLYSAERSIVDVVRMRHRQGSGIAWEALRRWLALPGRSPAQLIEIASQLPNAEPPLRRALEVLL